jgi:hypothetical protein
MGVDVENIEREIDTSRNLCVNLGSFCMQRCRVVMTSESACQPNVVPHREDCRDEACSTVVGVMILQPFPRT